jgi:flagellar motor switch protein FliM
VHAYRFRGLVDPMTMTTTELKTPGPPPKTRTIEVYDFRRPTTLAREHSRVLELAFETFARQWGTQLTSRVRVKSLVAVETVSMQTYDEYAASLPSTTAMVLCALEGHGSKAVIQFPNSSALSWVGRMLGGNGSAVAPDRKFTQIEQSLVKRLMDDALEDLRYSLGSLLSVPVSVDTIVYNSQFAQAAATSELMIVATFTIAVGDNQANATLAFPADVLLHKLGAVNPTDTTANARHLIEGQLGRVPVHVSMQLSEVAVKPSTILGLAVGDLLPVPHQKSKPFDITVRGHRIATAVPGTNGSRIAAIIVSTEETPK